MTIMTPMGTDNTKGKRSQMFITRDTTATEVRDWTVVVRKPRANRFQPTIFEGTWSEAERMAQAITNLTELEAYYLHTDTDWVETHTGSRVAIKGEPVAIEELLEECRHTIDDIEGYRVITELTAGTKSIHFYRAHEFALAVKTQWDNISRGRQSRLSNLYSCGHWSEDLDRYYGTERVS